MKKYIIIAGVVVLSLFFVYKYIYQSHRNIAEESADFTVSVAAIHQEFMANDSLAYAKYLDKTIIAKGKVTQVDSLANLVVLDEKLVVLLNAKSQSPSVLNTSVTVKGRFIGYDDLLDELKIDQATLIP